MPCGGAVYGEDNLVFVANDWHVALLPVLLQAHYRDHGQYQYARSVLVLHNAAHQGRGPPSDEDLFAVPAGERRAAFDLDDPVGGKHSNILKAGIEAAHRVVAVSRGYAWEVQTPEGGWGLHEALRHAAGSGKLAGIVNGIDTAAWNPGADPHIPRNYGDSDVAEGKYAARVALAARLGHAAPDARPLVAFVGRLAEQKGVDLVVELIGRMAGTGRAHFVVLGTGDPAAEESLRRVAAAFPGTVDVVLGFDEGLAHLVQAAADIVLVPSRFEPCGLTQLYAQRYGAIPVVRATGGLVDTVVDATAEAIRDGRATGFTFGPCEPGALVHAVERALDLHADRDRWSGLVRHAMRQDWSWDTSAREYLRLFERTLAAPPAAAG